MTKCERNTDHKAYNFTELTTTKTFKPRSVSHDISNIKLLSRQQPTSSVITTNTSQHNSKFYIINKT